MNQVFGIYFDHERDGIFYIDAIQLASSNPYVSWLKREVEEGRTQAQRLEAARFDLVRIAAGWQPDAAELQAAPELTNWLPVLVGRLLLLEGNVFGHPLIGEDRRILTSALIAIDAREGRWARTLSRFYRLGASDRLTIAAEGR